MDRLLREEGFKARKLSWQDLGFEAGVEGVSARTIARAMGDTIDYSRCIACQKRWFNNSTAKSRKAFAEVILYCYPKPENWHRVRFSDEVH